MSEPRVKGKGLRWKIDILIIFLLLFTFPLFFYKLGQSSLVSWDEAWYAEIGRNILITGDFMRLSWNGQPYTDHPPAGFWLIASGIGIFGQTEFGVRSFSAVSGILCVIILYFLGKELFNRVVGISSALALTSAIWFLARARSGNLDVFLAMFFILTLFLALKSIKNRFYIIPFFVSLAALFLTKTIVPLTIIPALILIFSSFRISKKNNIYLILGFLSFVAITGVWVYIQLIYKSDFISRYFMIGLPGVEVKTSYLDNLKLAKTYLHDGIGKWFWPGILGIFSGLFLFQKRFFILSLFFLTFFIPFVFSPKGHIWHLVPLHPILILAFFGVAYELGNVILDLVQDLFRGRFRNQFGMTKEVFVSAGLLSVCFYFTTIQLRQIWYSFIDIPRYISDEAILSTEAGKYPDKFFIDGDFGPTAVWYSKKHVQHISNDELDSMFKKQGNFTKLSSFLLITKQYRLDEIKLKKNEYKILKSDRDKILIFKNQ